MKDKLRVLRIITRMNVGGPSYQISQLLSGLSDLGFEHHLLFGNCPATEKEFDFLTSDVNTSTRLKHLSTKINAMSDLRAFIEIRHFMKQWKPDIVHTHTAKAGLLGRLAAFSLNREIKIVHTFHGHLLTGYFTRAFTYIVITIEKILAKLSNRLISVGTIVASDLVKKGIGTVDKFVIINPGVERPKSKKNDRTRFHRGVRRDGFKVLWIGRLVEIKNPELVIEISKFMKIKSSNVEFLIAGDGPLRTALEVQIRQLQLPIQILGWRDDVPTLLDEVDLVIQTSHNEGTPISLIQAQLAGIPVISTSVGSIPEIVTDGVTGHLVSHDYESFARIIEYYLKHTEELEAVGQRARNFALQKFSIQRFLTDHANLYRQLINK
jgi:glycosyltransferase involved in cell wall biosynthesis